MQVLDYTNDKSVSTWSDDTGSYIRGFLISTKPNKNNWRISDTNYVKDFVGKDFAVIPNRIGNKTLLDGHVVGSKEEVLKQYADNSYGKIVKVLGPFNYPDGGFWYEHITKLNNDKVASALMQHGSGTLVPFATSPHIFAYEGNDTAGWHNWEPAGIVLVSNPAYGEQSIITKSCKGEQTTCTNALSLSQIQENKIAAVVNLVSSLVNSDTSESITMSSKDTLQVADDLNKAAVNLGDNSNQVQETKQPVQTEQQNKIITDEIKPTTSQAESSKEVEILRQKIADMENEKKTEILSELWSVISDEKERNRTIKEYFDTTDLNQVKALKQFADRLSPLFREQGKQEANRLIKEQQDKELQSMKKNKIASTNYKFQLPGEPKEPEKEKEVENKTASTSKVGEIAELQALLKGVIN